VAITRLELENLYVRIERPLYNFALRWVWNPAIAEEVVQDAFIRLWQRRDTIDGSTLQGLLYVTVKRLAINELRKIKLREAVPVLDWIFPSANGAEVDLVLQSELQEMREQIEKLPEDVRETLLMCEFSDMNYEQIGQALGIPAGTVASRRNRALKILKEKLGDQDGLE